eukprot:scaffold130520_cov19-Prasinocladus_malaysianus.AAC.1
MLSGQPLDVERHSHHRDRGQTQDTFACVVQASDLWLIRGFEAFQAKVAATNWQGCFRGVQYRLIISSD